jgi:hypothetical protein
LPDSATIEVVVQDDAHRPVGVDADTQELGLARRLTIRLQQDRQFHLLFDNDHHLDERYYSGTVFGLTRRNRPIITPPSTLELFSHLLGSK